MFVGDNNRKNFVPALPWRRSPQQMKRAAVIFISTESFDRALYSVHRRRLPPGMQGMRIQ
jgi:hypothetical protein